MMARRRHVRGGRVRAATAVVLLVLLLTGVQTESSGADLFHRGILTLLKYRISEDVASYDFAIDSLVPLDGSEAAAFRRRMTAGDTTDIQISTEAHGSNGWFLIRTWEPTLCFVADDAVHACVYGLGQRYGASCAEQPAGNLRYVLACKVTVLTGTGVFGTGTAYFAMRPPFMFLGYLPGYEFYSSTWYTSVLDDDEGLVGQLVWTAEDRSNPETPGYIDRCITIRFKPFEIKGQLFQSKERCEAYRIDLDAGSIVHLSGRSSIGGLLMNTYKREGESIIGLKR